MICPFLEKYPDFSTRPSHFVHAWNHSLRSKSILKSVKVLIHSDLIITTCYYCHCHSLCISYFSKWNNRWAGGTCQRDFDGQKVVVWCVWCSGKNSQRLETTREAAPSPSSLREEDRPTEKYCLPSTITACHCYPHAGRAARRIWILWATCRSVTLRLASHAHQRCLELGGLLVAKYSPPCANKTTRSPSWCSRNAA